jgi:lipopolysaccharide export system permease protein
LPDLCGMILPLAFVTSVLHVLHQMLRDNELVILRGAGFSNSRIARGILGASVFWACVVWGLQGYVAPWGLRQFKAMEARMKAADPKRLMRSGECVTSGALTFWAGEREGLWVHPLFLHDMRTSRPVTVLAAEGLVQGQGDRTMLVLRDGIRQEWNPETGRVTHLVFARYTLEMDKPPAPVRRPPKSFERSVTELWEGAQAGIPEHEALRLRAEAHQRVLSGVCLVAMVSLGLAVALGRPWSREKRLPFVWGFASVAGLQGLDHGLINMAGRHSWALGAAWALPVAVGMGSWGVLLSARWRARARTWWRRKRA